MDRKLPSVRVLRKFWQDAFTPPRRALALEWHQHHLIKVETPQRAREQGDLRLIHRPMHFLL